MQLMEISPANSLFCANCLGFLSSYKIQELYFKLFFAVMLVKIIESKNANIVFDGSLLHPVGVQVLSDKLPVFHHFPSLQHLKVFFHLVHWQTIVVVVVVEVVVVVVVVVGI